MKFSKVMWYLFAPFIGDNFVLMYDNSKPHIVKNVPPEVSTLVYDKKKI